MGERNFLLLGITMSTRLQDTVEMNYQEKLPILRSVFNFWSKRILTSLGKLVVIKSLVIPKLNHLFIGLPNPSVDFIKSLQDMCFNFLWKKVPDKIRRQVVMQGYEKGGLRMVDINQFINALKISWIRRSITEGKDCFIIHNTMYPFYKYCLLYGSEYIKMSLERINNPLWKDTYNALHALSISGTPLWYNHNIKVGRRSCFIRNWFQSSVAYINDIMDRNGNFYSLNAFQEKWSVNTNFLTYQGILAACESYLGQLSFQHLPLKEQQSLCSPLLYSIMRNKKGCRIIYDILVNKNVQPASVVKWERDIRFEVAPDWGKYFALPFKTTTDSTLLCFQPRLVLRILSTNCLLTKMGIKENENCSFCKLEAETLKYLFWECTYTQTSGESLICF